MSARNQHPADRLAAARFAREQRARFPMLSGGWTYREWCCRQVFIATRNKLAALTKARKDANKVVPLRAIVRAADLNAFYTEADLSEPSAAERERREVHRALEAQQQRLGETL